MKGKYRVVVQNKRIRYDFEIKRNITVIRGDSATGKTALVDMIREYYENGQASGIELLCDKECVAVEGRNWEMQLSTVQDSIVFIDEGNSFVLSVEFADKIQKTDNYYVIVTRESLETLPYSVEEIYGIRNSGKYGSLKRTYNEFYNIYGQNQFEESIRPDIIITEDSRSGFQFFKKISLDHDLECISADGKSNIFSTLLSTEDKKVLVIADGAAFGSEMEKIMGLCRINIKISVYLPESFEWLILKSGIVEANEVKDILKNPCEYIESSMYFSWERFFSRLLTSRTQNIWLKYSKKELNPVYLQKNERARILSTMEKIDFSWKK